MTSRKCWFGHRWVSNDERILVNTPTAWTFPERCSRCGKTRTLRQQKSVQQVLVEQGSEITTKQKGSEND